MDLALSNLQWLICHKTKPNQTKRIYPLICVSMQHMENFVNMRRGKKKWIIIERLTNIWKSDFVDKIKREFFQTVAVLMLLYGCTT